jgi:hypothetical protein
MFDELWAVAAVQRQAAPVQGTDLLRRGRQTITGGREVGRNYVLHGGGRLAVSPLPDECQGGDWTIRARIASLGTSANGTCVSIVHGAGRRWTACVKENKWVLNGVTPEHTPAVEAIDQVVEFRWREERWSDGSTGRRLAVAVNGQVLFSNGRLDGELEGLTLGAGDHAAWVGAVELRGPEATATEVDAASIDPTPRTKTEIQKALGVILSASNTDGFPEEDLAAARLLNAYRYLAGAPHDVVLDRALTAPAQAACELFVVLGGSSHHPKNPGWPVERYDSAYRGASSSNLGSGYEGSDITQFIRSTMHDSDNENLWELGHRCWNLNPLMRRTGYGKSGPYRAMWAHDESRGAMPPFVIIAWPPPGFVPVDYLQDSTPGRPPAWSVHFHPSAYALSDYEAPSVRLWRVTQPPPQDAAERAAWLAETEKQDPIELHGATRLDRYTDLRGVAWLPKLGYMEKGDRFWVEVRGLVDPNTGGPKSLRYYVEGF